MITTEDLTDFLASKNISRRDKICLILAQNSELPLSIPTIKEVAKNAGLREIDKWNVADILVKSTGVIVKVPQGWKLTKNGLQFIKTNFLESATPIQETAINLRSHLDKIQNADTRAFVEESIRCLEGNLYRSAVVMSWVGAISVLYDHVITNRLSDFNAEAKRRKSEWKAAVSKDDLALMKESDFLDILAVLSILGKNTKEHLKNNCLNLRNSCGHPSSLQLGDHMIEAHIEFLMMNVYEKF